MATLLLYIRTFRVSSILAVAAFIGTIWLLWPVDGVLSFAVIAGLTVFFLCALVEALVIDCFVPFD